MSHLLLLPHCRSGQHAASSSSLGLVWKDQACAWLGPEAFQVALGASLWQEGLLHLGHGLVRSWGPRRMVLARRFAKVCNPKVLTSLGGHVVGPPLLVGQEHALGCPGACKGQGPSARPGKSWRAEGSITCLVVHSGVVIVCVLPICPLHRGEDAGGRGWWWRARVGRE